MVRLTRKITMVLAAVLCLASCQDQYGRFDPQRAQGSVKFHLGMEGVESKAVYSGVVDGGVERIDWQAGDAIGIYCAKVKEDKYARYRSCTATPAMLTELRTAWHSAALLLKRRNS